MKVQQIQQQNPVVNNNPQFKSADGVLRYLAVNQAVGANGVDLAFMVIPRTGSDMIRRGPLAGMETLRREIMGTINDSLIGVYGILGGLVAAKLMGIGKYTKEANSILAAPETLNILAQNKANQIKSGTSQVEYLKDTLKNVKCFNPEAAHADKDGYVKLSEKTIDEVAEMLDKAITEKREFRKDWNSTKSADSMHTLINKILADTGAESDVILEGVKDSKLPKSKTNLKALLEDIFKVSKSFNEENVIKAFEEQVKNNKEIKDNTYIKSILKYMKSKSYAGFAMASAVGLSVQPINMYISRKKTGSDGFVGVEGRTKDTSAGFMALKGMSAAAFFGMVLATLETGLKGFMGKMAFKGFWPSVEQLKGVYGITIISRVMSARDKDELRESLTKDTLGYLSWLVLGNFVNKMVAKKLDPTVMNETQELRQKGYWKQIFKSSLKTRDEVLVKTLSDNGIAISKTENGKTVAKKFGEMLKDLDNLSPEIKKVAKKKLRVLNLAQGAGYLFSGLVLGLGIPNLNIYITNTLDKKRKAKQAQAQKAEVA